MSEKVTAVELVERLNQYFEVMVKIILQEQGTIDKFGGDAILSVWGAPEAIVNDSVFAIRAALNMQNAIVGFNQILESRGATPLAMGIGIHSGKFIAGNIGSKDRMEYTIIGDDVNTAKRVETTADGHMLMVSEAALANHLDMFIGNTFNPILVKGKSLPLSLTNIRGMKNGDNYLLTLPCDFDSQFGKIFPIL
jgi:adenylate cyclase